MQLVLWLEVAQSLCSRCLFIALAVRLSCNPEELVPTGPCQTRRSFIHHTWVHSITLLFRQSDSLVGGTITFALPSSFSSPLLTVASQTSTANPTAISVAGTSIVNGGPSITVFKLQLCMVFLGLLLVQVRSLFRHELTPSLQLPVRLSLPVALGSALLVSQGSLASLL